VQTYAVRYELDGTTKQADVTMQTPTGRSQQSDIDVPMMDQETNAPGLTFTEFGLGDFVYVSGQNSQSYGTLTCRIKVNGVVMSQNTASGGFSIATCEERVA
jgi:hypothetical protein